MYFPAISLYASTPQGDGQRYVCDPANNSVYSVDANGSVIKENSYQFCSWCCSG